ncbi:MAG: hypothetical protein LUH15_17815 [Tannerellaceae bacterium]|nr:hypothetical protein [Tannerellaceae bacterium]
MDHMVYQPPPYIDSIYLADYYQYYEIFSLGKQSAQAITDSLSRRKVFSNLQQYQLTHDIQQVTAHQIISNIEWAFKVYKEQPWNEYLPFDDFCESILPYRIGNESLDVSWREKLYNRYNPLLDSIKNKPESKDPVYVAKFLLNEIYKEKIYFTNSLPAGPNLGARVADLRSGTCREFTDMVTYIMRAVGIPCGTDFMIMRGDNNAAHFWNYFFGKEGNTWFCESPIRTLREPLSLWSPKGKVYRQTFQVNRDIQKEFRKRKQKAHPTFDNALFKDVTKIYSNDAFEILPVPLEYVYEEYRDLENRMVYLCSSNRKEWIPIEVGFLDNDNLVFRDVEGDVVFRLGIYKENRLELISDPFLFERSSGNLRLFPQKNQLIDATFYYKYHLYDETFIFRTPDGVFEGSNDPHFLQKDTLYMIGKIPLRLFTSVYPRTNKIYRYVRYYGPEGGHCNMAEVAFFENQIDSIPLKGKIIGTPGCWEQDGSREYTNLFDGDPYTSFNYIHPSGGWAGLDLGKPMKIGKIIYTPRNRDNFIRKGDFYECFYWKDKGWKSLGIQKADSDSLNYKIPEGSLLYLKITQEV